MTASVIDASRDVAPDLWRRYVGLLLRGLTTSPDGHPSLAPGQVDTILARSKPGRRRG
jgi:hypothetical protein